MDMKKILQAIDEASTKPVEGSNDMKKFLSVVTEGANPHKVTLPVQMAMQHYAEPKVEQSQPIREVKKAAMSSMLYQYYTKAEEQLAEETKSKKELISEQARQIAQRVLAKESFNPEYDDEAGMAQGSLHTLKRAVDGLMSTIEDKENLPEWCQEKISLAEDYLVTVWDYLQSEQEQHGEVDEARYGGRDAYQRDYDNSRTGFGRPPREDDEYHNGPDPEQFKIHCTMTDLETGQPRNRIATINTVHGHAHAVNVALKMYHDQGYKDAKVAGGLEESKKKTLKNSNPCWKGYHPVGTKEKNGRTVPNCVPKE